MKLAGSLIKGISRMPRDNDSAWLLDPHKRGLRNLERMRRYQHDESVDMVIVGAGAGGVTLAQRLARAGWRILILEKGPFWDPDRDWVSDEKAASPIYWTDNHDIRTCLEIPMDLIDLCFLLIGELQPGKIVQRASNSFGSDRG